MWAALLWWPHCELTQLSIEESLSLSWWLAVLTGLQVTLWAPHVVRPAPFCSLVCSSSLSWALREIPDLWKFGTKLNSTLSAQHLAIYEVLAHILPLDLHGSSEAHRVRGGKWRQVSETRGGTCIEWQGQRSHGLASWVLSPTLDFLQGACLWSCQHSCLLSPRYFQYKPLKIVHSST